MIKTAVIIMKINKSELCELLTEAKIVFQYGYVDNLRWKAKTSDTDQ